MKVIEIIKKYYVPLLVGGLGGLLSLSVSAEGYGVGSCVQDEPGASTVVKTGGVQRCDKISGQFGCRVRFFDEEYYEEGLEQYGDWDDGHSGRCRVRDDEGQVLFTVEAEFDSYKGLSWRIVQSEGGEPLPAKVNTVIAKSVDIDRGNACDYIYDDEATEGEGQGWFTQYYFPEGDFNESLGGEYGEYGEYGHFAHVDAAFFCTDGETDDKPAPSCDDIDQTALCNNLGTDDERFVIVMDPDADDWNPVACTCNEEETWTACDENATNEADKCTGDGINKALPVSFEGINDGTTICRTIGGERKCWKRR